MLLRTKTRIPLGAPLIHLGVCSFEGVMFLPESPRYLLFRGNQDSAKHSLGRLMALPPDSPEAEAEVIEIQLALGCGGEFVLGLFQTCYSQSKRSSTLDGNLVASVASVVAID